MRAFGRRVSASAGTALGIDLVSCGTRSKEDSIELLLNKSGIKTAAPLHDYASSLYSHPVMTATEPITSVSDAPRPTAVALPRSERGIDPAGGPRRVRVGIIGATGYV